MAYVPPDPELMGLVRKFKMQRDENVGDFAGGAAAGMADIRRGQSVAGALSTYGAQPPTGVMSDADRAAAREKYLRLLMEEEKNQNDASHAMRQDVLQAQSQQFDLAKKYMDVVSAAQTESIKQAGESSRAKLAADNTTLQTLMAQTDKYRYEPVTPETEDAARAFLDAHGDSIQHGENGQPNVEGTDATTMQDLLDAYKKLPTPDQRQHFLQTIEAGTGGMPGRPIRDWISGQAEAAKGGGGTVPGTSGVSVPGQLKEAIEADESAIDEKTKILYGVDPKTGAKDPSGGLMGQWQEFHNKVEKEGYTSGPGKAMSAVTGTVMAVLQGKPIDEKTAQALKDGAGGNPDAAAFADQLLQGSTRTETGEGTAESGGTGAASGAPVDPNSAHARILKELDALDQPNPEPAIVAKKRAIIESPMFLRYMQQHALPDGSLPDTEVAFHQLMRETRQKAKDAIVASRNAFGQGGTGAPQAGAVAGAKPRAVEPSPAAASTFGATESGRGGSAPAPAVQTAAPTRSKFAEGELQQIASEEKEAPDQFDKRDLMKAFRQSYGSVGTDVGPSGIRDAKRSLRRADKDENDDTEATP